MRVVDEATVAVHEVRHVLGDVEGGAGDGEKFRGSGHSQLQHGLPQAGPHARLAPHHRLDGLDVAELRHVGRLEQRQLEQ